MISWCNENGGKNRCKTKKYNNLLKLRNIVDMKHVFWLEKCTLSDSLFSQGWCLWLKCLHVHSSRTDKESVIFWREFWTVDSLWSLRVLNHYRDLLRDQSFACCQQKRLNLCAGNHRNTVKIFQYILGNSISMIKHCMLSWNISDFQSFASLPQQQRNTVC